MAGGRGTFPSVISRVASIRQTVSAQPVRSGQIGSLHVSQSSCNREFKKLVDSLRQDSAHLAKGIRCKPKLPSCLADAGSAKSNIKEIAEGAVRYGQRALTEQKGNWQTALAQQAEEMLRTLIVPLTICAKKNSLRPTMMLKISRAGARD
jgi:hypothetical protein